MTPLLSLHGGSATRARRALLAISGTAALVVAAPASASVYVGTPGGDNLRAKHASGDTLWGGGGADTLTGAGGPDFIYGVRSNNTIDGKGGNDYIEGGAGSDRIQGGTGNDTIYGSSGQDVINGGDGNDYIDVGGGNDAANGGNGDDVIITGSGGGRFDAGGGNNTVYYGSGIAYIKAGSGVNNIWLSGTAVRELDCGGNPNSVVHVNSAALAQYVNTLDRLKRRSKGCATFVEYDGNARIEAKIAGLWESFDLRGGDGRDKLFGGHGGGTIDAGQGDNEVWADHNEDEGLPNSRTKTTTISVGDGNNKVFGGRGTNVITAGNGNNFIRAGAYVNTIRVGSGTNLIRLQGNIGGSNSVTITGAPTNGEGTFVESLANGRKPTINCVGGAKAAIVYGNTKPVSNCRPMYSARSKKGKELSVLLTPGVQASEPLFDEQLQPGQGAGVPRPATSA